MLKARLHDGTLLMDWFAAQRSHFWKGSGYKDFSEYKQMIVSKEVDTQSYYWIQFPKPHTLATPNEFLDKILELERFRWFKQYIFNIEFNPHIHSHLIIISPEKDIRPNRIIMNISKHLEINKNHIECKRYSHSFNNRVNYIKGLKVPQDKQLLVEADIRDRENYNIMSYYTDALQTEAPST